jgi:hypothetical protein
MMHHVPKAIGPLLLCTLLVTTAGLSGCDKTTAKKRTPGASGPNATDDQQSRQTSPSAKIVVPQHDCKSAPACLEAGYCTQEKGSCVVKRNEDCEAASVCKRDGKCAADKGQCVVGDSKHCKQSARCKHKGECTLKEGSCTAASHDDCKQSKRCEHKGECNFQNGECVAGKK